MSKVTAIIPSLTGVDDEYLKLCVESLRESGFDGDIIIVSNGEKAYAGLKLDFEGVSIHLTTKAQGQCNAVNVGAGSASGDCKYLFVINSDMYFSPGWDKNLRFDYKCFSPNLVEPTNNNGSADPFLKVPGGYTLDEFDKDAVDEFVNNYLSGNHKKHIEEGFNLPFFIDINLFRTIGGYDTKYDPWGSNSDTDLQTLINVAGVTPMRLRDVLVYHFSNKSGTFDGTHQEEWQKNFDYYREKFGYTRDDEPKADVWYNKNMVLEDKLVFDPQWKGKYLES